MPGLLVGFGFLTLDNPEYLESNETIQKVITAHYAGFHTNIDNYTRHVPIGAAYALNLAGIKGKHDLLDLSILYALSSFINNTLTKNIKSLTKERRPDLVSYDAFPSGHTSTAFSNAEIMHQEYKQESLWFGVAGYSFAVATGSLRMLNNRHWLSDVVAGAGIGILSTRVAYIIYPLLQQKISTLNISQKYMKVAPFFWEGSYGLSAGFNL